VEVKLWFFLARSRAGGVLEALLAAPAAGVQGASTSFDLHNKALAPPLKLLTAVFLPLLAGLGGEEDRRKSSSMLDLEVAGADCLLVLRRGTIWRVAGSLPPDPWWILDWSLPVPRPFDKAPRS
jgi:hypothetical protein